MSSRIFIYLLLGALSIMCTPDAFAGSQANAEAKFSPESIVSFAKNVEKYAAQKGARAFIIARVGRPEKDLPKGIKFTHTAVAIYSSITLENEEQVQGYAIYNLYQKSDDKSTSFLMTDYPVDFFWGAQVLKAGVIIPNDDIQRGLIALVASGKYKELHNPKYSVIANPNNQIFQNCTEFTLDMLNAAIYQTNDSERLKANAAAYFDAQKVHTSRFKLMLGGLFMEDVSTKDHKGKVKTATFTSIANYLEKYDLVKHVTALNFDISNDRLIEKTL